MADYPQEPTSDEQLRNLQDQVRRLWTRIPPDPTYSVYQITQDDMFYDAALGGWYIEGQPYPHLVRQGNFIHLFGLLRWSEPTGPGYPYSSSYIIRPDNIPSEFRPASYRRIPASGIGFTDDRLWTLFVDPIPATFLKASDLHIDGGAVFPYADLTSGDDFIVNLGGLYAIEPDAHTYPGD